MQAHSFFPPAYKTISFREGDVFVFADQGKFGILKILKIDRISFSPGQTIQILDELFEVPIEDNLLVVGISLSSLDFFSAEEAGKAIASGAWNIHLSYVPIRTTGLHLDNVYVANQAV